MIQKICHILGNIASQMNIWVKVQKKIWKTNSANLIIFIIISKIILGYVIAMNFIIFLEYLFILD